MGFIRQIDSFLLKNNLQLDAVLIAPPVSLSPMQNFLTSQQFESLGRLCRTEILDYEQMRDLEAKLRDPANPVPDQLSIPVLKRLLSQAGAVKGDSEHLTSEIHVYQLQ